MLYYDIHNLNWYSFITRYRYNINILPHITLTCIVFANSVSNSMMLHCFKANVGQRLTLAQPHCLCQTVVPLKWIRRLHLISTKGYCLSDHGLNSYWKRQKLATIESYHLFSFVKHRLNSFIIEVLNIGGVVLDRIVLWKVKMCYQITAVFMSGTEYIKKVMWSSYSTSHSI